jgi:hypothetical protein
VTHVRVLTDVQSSAGSVFAMSAPSAIAAQCVGQAPYRGSMAGVAIDDAVSDAQVPAHDTARN